MMTKIAVYAGVISLTLVLGAAVVQSTRYAALEKEVGSLTRKQEEWIESNKRLIMDIATLSSPERIEKIARDDLGLVPVAPEDVMQVRIASDNANDAARNDARDGVRDGAASNAEQGLTE